MANGEDQRINCVDCGEEFLFTAGEQAFYRERGLTHAPTRCKRCRESRKGQRPERPAAGGGAPRRAASSPPRERAMHTTVCADCGAETQVPFVPTGERPVYCKDCFQNHRPPRAGGPPARAPRGGEGPRRAPRGAAAPAVLESPSGRAQGVVKWFNDAKGFGFIQDEGGEDLFVHVSAIRGEGLRTLGEGDRVEFDVVPGPKGKQASDVVRIG